MYLLNRDHLGGYDQGPDGADDVVQRTGPRGGVWGRPGVWPGDGGYVYIPTSSGQNGGGLFDVYKYGLSGTGTPSLSLVASSPDVFGWGSGPPVITSDGTTSGSALVWTVWSANRSGAGGQLRAYDPVPVNGKPVLRYSAPIGTATNYSIPGVGAGRLYVGTRDGKVLGFGSPVTQPLGGSGLSFPRTTIGSSDQMTLTLTADRDLTLSSLGSSSDQFTLGHALSIAARNAGDRPDDLGPGHVLSHADGPPRRTGQRRNRCRRRLVRALGNRTERGRRASGQHPDRVARRYLGRRPPQRHRDVQPMSAART